MGTRREFLKTGAAALTVAATRPLFGWQGANDRVRMGVIGMGGRSSACARATRGAADGASGRGAPRLATGAPSALSGWCPRRR